MKGRYFAVISPQETYLASAPIFSRQVVLWSIETGEIEQQFEGHEAGTHTVVFSDDETHLATVGRDGLIRVWTIDDPRLVATRTVDIEHVHAVRFSNESKVVVDFAHGRRSVHLSWDR